MYVARRRVTRAVLIDDFEHGQSATAGEIIESDDSVWTGLFDAAGQEIYRVRDPIRLGFEKE